MNSKEWWEYLECQGPEITCHDTENMLRDLTAAEARIKELEGREREAFVAGFEHCESVGRGYTSKKLEAEALRRYPKSEEV